MQQSLTDAYEQLFSAAISEYNAKQRRKNRKIDNYLTKIKNSGNKKKQFYETVVQIGYKDDTGVVDERGKLTDVAAQAKEILDDYARHFQERNLNSIYEKKISVMQATLDKMSARVKELKSIVKKYESFLEMRGLAKIFKEFIRPKGVVERLQRNKEIVENKKKIQQKQSEYVVSRKNDIAI